MRESVSLSIEVEDLWSSMVTFHEQVVEETASRSLQQV